MQTTKTRLPAAMQRPENAWFWQAQLPGDGTVAPRCPRPTPGVRLGLDSVLAMLTKSSSGCDQTCSLCLLCF